MFWYSIEYQWGGCWTAPWLARACPTHKKMPDGRSTFPTTTCEVSTSYLKSKDFRHKSVRSIVVQLSSGGFYIGKPLKIRFMLKCHNSLFYYRENWYKPSSRRYLCSVWAKIRNSKILGTFLEVKGSLINGGGGVVPHIRTPRQGGTKIRFRLFFA